MKKAQTGVAVAIVLMVIILVFITILLTVMVTNPDLLNKKDEPKVVKVSEKEVETVTCNYPLTKYGNGCCLDQNYNGICDNMELKKQETVQNTRYTPAQPIDSCTYPYIQINTLCCLDENRNGICDIDDRYNNNYRDDYNKGTLDSPLHLESFDIYSDEVSLEIKNEGDVDLKITDIDVDGCDGLSPDTVLAADKTKTYHIGCRIRSSNYDRDIEVTYKASGANDTEKSTGRIRGYSNYDYGYSNDPYLDYNTNYNSRYNYNNGYDPYRYDPYYGY